MNSRLLVQAQVRKGEKMRSRRRNSLFVLLSFLFVNQAVGLTVIYDVDFTHRPHDVPHFVGQQIPVDSGPAPRHSASQVVFGEQIVRHSFGPLEDTPVEFISGRQYEFNYSQVAFEVDFLQQFPSYEVSFDAYVASAGNSSDTLSLFFDTPGMVRVDYTPDGRVRRHGGTRYATTIGTFDPWEAVSSSVIVSIASNSWDIWVDNSLLYSGRFHPSGNPNRLEDIRLSFSGAFVGDSIGIDNIKIIGIPEPATILLLGLGGLAVLRKRRR